MGILKSLRNIFTGAAKNPLKTAGLTGAGAGGLYFHDEISAVMDMATTLWDTVGEMGMMGAGAATLGGFATGAFASANSGTFLGMNMGTILGGMALAAGITMVATGTMPLVGTCLVAGGAGAMLSSLVVSSKTQQANADPQAQQAPQMSA